MVLLARRGRRWCHGVSDPLAARHRELTLALKIQWSTLDLLMGEVGRCGAQGELLVQEMRRAKGELDRLTDECERLREETLRDLFQRAQEDNEAVYERVQGKVAAVKEEVGCLQGRVDALKDSEWRLAHRVFKVVPVSFLTAHHPEAQVWKPATHGQVEAYLHHLREDLAPYEAIQLADGKVLSPAGEVLTYTEHDTVYFPQAVIVTPYL